jgi:hypothetical protein
MKTTLCGGSLLELVITPPVAAGSAGVIGRAYSYRIFCSNSPDPPSHQNADRAPSRTLYQTPESVTINRILTLRGKRGGVIQARLTDAGGTGCGGVGAAPSGRANDRHSGPTEGESDREKASVNPQAQGDE